MNKAYKHTKQESVICKQEKLTSVVGNLISILSMKIIQVKSLICLDLSAGTSEKKSR